MNTRDAVRADRGDTPPDSPYAGRRAAARHRRRPFETRGNGFRDLLLDVEDPTQTSVVALRPQLIAVRDVGEAHHAQLIARPAHAAVEHRGDLQLLADRLQVVGFAAERERRCAGGDAADLSPETTHSESLRPRRPEPVLIFRRAHVGKGKHRDRGAAASLQPFVSAGIADGGSVRD